MIVWGTNTKRSHSIPQQMTIMSGIVFFIILILYYLVGSIFSRVITWKLESREPTTTRNTIMILK